MVEVFCHEIEPHVDACDKIFVPHQSISEIAAENCGGRSEYSVESQYLHHRHWYVGSRLESEFTVEGEIP